MRAFTYLLTFDFAHVKIPSTGELLVYVFLLRRITMDTVLYEFSVKSRWTLFSNFTSHVKVYENRVHIERDGRLDSIPEEVTVHFDNVSGINYTKNTDYLLSYISFTGMSQSNAQSITGLEVGNVMMATASANPWNDPYGIVFKLNMYDEGKEYYQKLLEIFNNYKSTQQSKVSANNNPQESALDQLKKLKELYDAGIVTEQEYEEKRVKLLERV